MKEYQIGEELHVGNKTVRCVDVDHIFCDGCFFADLCCQDELISGITKLVGHCAESRREDKKNIIFKIVEDSQ